MTQRQEGQASNQDQNPNSDYEPNFTLPKILTIGEDNWEEYKDRGFFVTMGVVELDDLAEELKLAQDMYGSEHVYLGDAWEYAEERPLKHKPGIGIYVHPDGQANVAKWRSQHFPHERPGGPAVS